VREGERKGKLVFEISFLRYLDRVMKAVRQTRMSAGSR
jgi:hypothetical protein